MEIYEQLTHYKFGTKNWFSSVCNPHTKVDTTVCINKCKI